MTKTNKDNYIVLVDMDDTITDMLSVWVETLNKNYRLSVRYEDITDWNINLFFPTLTNEQIFAPLYTDEFWLKVMPKYDAIKYIKKLKDDGCKVFICTSTNYKTIKAKMDNLLFKYFDYLSWNDVIVTSNKQLINADLLIDDGVHNLIGGKYKGILMDAPHNRKFDEKKHGIIRVKTWREIYALIKSMTK